MGKNKIAVVLTAALFLGANGFLDYIAPQSVSAAEAGEAESKEDVSIEVTEKFSDNGSSVTISVKKSPANAEVYVIKDEKEPIQIIGDSYEVTETGKYKFIAVADGKEVSQEIVIDKLKNENKEERPQIRYDLNGYIEGSYTEKDVKLTLSTDKKENDIYFTDYTGKWYKVNNGEMNISKDGIYDLKVKAVSPKGVESDIKSLKVLIDKVVPGIEVTGNLSDKAESVDLSIKKTTGISGVKRVTVSEGNNIEEVKGSQYKAVKNGKYIFTITDNNGLSSSYTVNINNILEKSSQNQNNNQQQADQQQANQKNEGEKVYNDEVKASSAGNRNESSAEKQNVYTENLNAGVNSYNYDKGNYNGNPSYKGDDGKGEYVSSVKTGDIGGLGFLICTMVSFFTAARFKKK